MLDRYEWLQPLLERDAYKLIRRHFRDLSGSGAVRRPAVILNPRLTSTAGRYTYEDDFIEIASLYYRDHGLDGTLRVLKHELSHWAARWYYGSAVPAHGQEWWDLVLRLDPKASILMPHFAFRERSRRA